MHIGVLVVGRPASELDGQSVWESLLEFETLLNSQNQSGRAEVLIRIESNRRPRGIRRLSGVAAQSLQAQIADRTLQAVGGVCQEGPSVLAVFTALLSLKEPYAADWPSVFQADLYKANKEDPELFAQIARTLSRTAASLGAYAAYAFDGTGGMTCAEHMLTIGREREARRWRPEHHIHGVEPIVVIPPGAVSILGGEERILAALGNMASGFEYPAGRRAVLVAHGRTFSQARDILAADELSREFLKPLVPEPSDVAV